MANRENFSRRMENVSFLPVGDWSIRKSHFCSQTYPELENQSKMNENISDDEGGDSIDPFDPNVTDQDDSEEDDGVADDQRKIDHFGFQKFKIKSVNLIIFYQSRKTFSRK